MSLPAHKKYIDSGQEWLGAVPAHWSVKRLGHFFDERREKASDTEFEPLSVTMKGIVPRLETAAKTQDGDNRKKVLKGDFVINSRSDRKGSSGVAPMDGSVSLICIVAKPKGIEPVYAHHLLRSVPFQEEFYRNGKGIVADLWSTGYSEMKNIVIPVPTADEQQQIACFLDHETAKIDALIAEQQRLIELLKEKRQAVISHSVTKGLNPNAPMKDSGVEWLGEVPAHWRVRRLKNIVTTRGGGTPSKEVSEFWEGPIPWVSPKDMKSERIVDTIDHVSDAAISNSSLSLIEPGAVLIVVRGMILLHSVPVAVNDVAVTINQDMKALYANKCITGNYLAGLLRGVKSAIFDYVDSSAHGTRKIEWERMEMMEVPVPPLSEQAAIEEFICKSISSIDLLINESEAAVKLMIERRSALISAAVTGKIDVRNWQPPRVKAERGAKKVDMEVSL